MKAIAIGCCPSSGSTLLADLFDAAPGAVCPPELYIFSVPEAYDYGEAFKSDAMLKHRFALATPYTARSRFFNRKYLAQVGLSEEELSRLIADSVSLKDFVTRFADHYARFREKHVEVFVEKTPINLNCARQFCRQFSDSLFIVVIRDGRSVVNSLMRRGYSLCVSIYIWLYQIMAGNDLKSFDNAVFVRYEEVTKCPFELTSQLLNRIGVRAEVSEIAESFPKNEYRKTLPRVNTWSRKEFDGDVQEVKYSLEKQLESFIVNCALVSRHPDGTFELLANFGDQLQSYGYEVKKQYRFVLKDFLESISKPFFNYKLRPRSYYLLAKKGYYLGAIELLVLLDLVLRRDISIRQAYKMVRSIGDFGYKMQLLLLRKDFTVLHPALQRLSTFIEAGRPHR